MADKTISFETAGNHWYWRAANPLDCQTGTVVQMPEDGKITSLELKVAGLDYADPVYGYQYHPGYMRPCIWSGSGGQILSKGAYTQLPISAGGSQPWVTFEMPDLTVKAGQRLIVGFWRRSDSTGYATQWDYNTDAAAGSTTVAHHSAWSGSGPMPFSVSETYSDRSLNFRLHYASGGRVKVWNGRSWVVAKTKVWNGSAWVEGTVKTWDGTAWNEAQG